ncbi:MAG: EscU/YscU/HrcU family type III secretion system export apparatus switch protein, partial [Clostridiales bacterium]|nr:EscU/YscU/HrcU family type III secretion system export apparatus switch protein [Clostridiales bacterium]
MAEMNKTEKATPKKRRDERKKGNVFQSKDVISVFVIIVGFFLLSKVGAFIVEQVKRLYINQLNHAQGLYELSVGTATQILRDSIIVFFMTTVPVIVVVALTIVVFTGVQTRFLVSGELIKFKFSRINIVEGFKRMFSLRSVVQLVKATLKVIVIMYIIYTSMKDLLIVTPDIINTSIGNTIIFMVDSILKMVYKICLLFAAIAIFDYAYQRFDYERKLRMTKQEVKEELKQTEGDPLVRSRIKERQRKMSLNRMIQMVPQADVVIRNPVHYAVCLKYDIDKDFAPIVIAKGRDYAARRIIQVAEANNVLITENKPLARSLYENIEVNEYITEEFY